MTDYRPEQPQTVAEARAAAYMGWWSAQGGDDDALSLPGRRAIAEALLEGGEDELVAFADSLARFSVALLRIVGVTMDSPRPELLQREQWAELLRDD